LKADKKRPRSFEAALPLEFAEEQLKGDQPLLHSGRLAVASCFFAGQRRGHHLMALFALV
jgi:hypothetical protein